MAIRANLFFSDGVVALDIHLDQERERVASAPDSDFNPGSMLWFSWDEEKLERGEKEFLGIEVAEIAALADEDIERIAGMPLPRIDYPEAGFANVTVADLLRWAKQHSEHRSTQQSMPKSIVAD